MTAEGDVDTKPAIGAARRFAREWLIAGLAVAAGTLIFAVPLIRHPYFPAQHEGLRYPTILVHITEAVRSGSVYPRWLPNLAAGYGYPTFVFYPPLFLLVGAWLSAACGWSSVVALGGAALAFAILGLTGIYRLSRLFADSATSVFVTLMYALTPYGFVNFYVRGDLSEFAGMQVTPWCLYFASALAVRCRSNATVGFVATGLALSLAAVTFAHPLVAIAAWPVTPVLLVSAWPSLSRDGRRALCFSGGGAMLLGALVSAPYWLPAQVLRGEVGVERAFEDYFVAAKHVVYPQQLFQREFEFGASLPDDPNDSMSFQLGAAHFALALLGAWFGRRRPLLIAACACYLALIALMLPFSRPLWEHVPVLRIFQFPWRLLAVTASLQAFCLIGWEDAPIGRTAARLALLGGLTIATAAWSSNQFRTNDPNLREPLERVHAQVDREAQRTKFEWITFANAEEFLPRTASTPAMLVDGRPAPLARGDRELVETPSGTVTPLPGNDPHHLRYRVTSEVPTIAVIQQFHFPGWSVSIDGAAIPADELAGRLLSDGRMSLSLPACPDGCVIEATYGGPPGSKILWGIAASAAASFCLGLSWYDARRRKSAKPPTARAG